MVLALGLPVFPTYGKVEVGPTTFDAKYWPLSENAFPFSLNGSVRCINTKGANYIWREVWASK